MAGFLPRLPHTPKAASKDHACVPDQQLWLIFHLARIPTTPPLPLVSLECHAEAPFSFSTQCSSWVAPLCPWPSWVTRLPISCSHHLIWYFGWKSEFYAKANRQLHLGWACRHLTLVWSCPGPLSEEAVPKLWDRVQASMHELCLPGVPQSKTDGKVLEVDKSKINSHSKISSSC